MQALSFAVHIPLVCFGIAFPGDGAVVEWLHHAHRRRLYLTLARRWTRMMLALFAAGVVTGHGALVRDGPAVARVHRDFGSVFGLGFAVEGFSFFLEAIFIGIYAYGWDRLSPRVHLLSGIPIVFSGFLGSLMVIAVNGWMNHPTGFRLVNGKAVDVHPVRRAVPQLQLLARAGAHVHRRLHGHRLPGGGLLRVCSAAGKMRPVRAHRLGDPADDRRVASLDPGAGGRLGRRGSSPRTSRSSWPPSRASATRPTGRAGAHPRRLHRRRGQVRHPHPRHALAARLPRPQRTRAGPRHACLPATARRSTWCGSRSRRWSASAACCWRCSARVSVRAAAAQADARIALVLPRRRAGRAAVGRRPDRRLGDHRGWPPAVGRLPRHAHRPGRHRGRRHPGRLRDARRRLPGAGVAVGWVLVRLAHAPRSEDGS